MCLAILVIAGDVGGADKRQAAIQPLSNDIRQALSNNVGLSAADTCLVSQTKQIIYRIDNWVTGNELYKSLLNPGLSCPNAYPYTVTGINMPMYFATATPIVVSVDIEAVDSTSIPGCTVPGVLKAISKDYSFNVPGAGSYDIWIPLDSPVVVNGPFFGGFFIGNALAPSVGAAVLIDSFPVTCATYNIWDTAIGFVDLCDTLSPDFPGRLAMEASGVPGGAVFGPVPAVNWLTPTAGELLLGQKELWIRETSGSAIIDYVSFSYSYNGGPYLEIGRDYDGVSPLRDGVHSTVTGNGFSYPWDFSLLTEGSYTLKATAVDTLGRSASATVAVTLEPTPPVAKIVNPPDGSDICSPVNILMTSGDENLQFVEVNSKQANWTYSTNLNLINQSSVGDVNGNAFDGNHAPGEFGDYYSGPVAATLALKVWYGRGYTAPFMNGATTLTMDSVTERMAGYFKTRQNKGTIDELMYTGLRDYLIAKGNEFNLDVRRHPDYSLLRQWAEEEQRTVIIGLGGNASPWMAVDGFSQWNQPDGTWLVNVVNPVTGAKEQLSMRLGALGGELLYLGTWHPIDIMISLAAKAWAVTRVACGADMDGSDGWSLTWGGNSLLEDSLYFFRTSGKDVTNYRATSTVLWRYNCSQIYTHGDYNNDDITDVGDLLALIDFIAKGSTPPIGGATRADANCDHYINMSDIVYFINYLFNGSSAPCR
jgi:hypothetical protein